MGSDFDYGDTCFRMAITTAQEPLLYSQILTLFAWKHELSLYTASLLLAFTWLLKVTINNSYNCTIHIKLKRSLIQMKLGNLN